MITNKIKLYYKGKESIAIYEKKGKIKVDLRKIDLISLKNKGLSIHKIGKMIGVPKLEVEKIIKEIERYKQHSGIF